MLSWNPLFTPAGSFNFLFEFYSPTFMRKTLISVTNIGGFILFVSLQYNTVAEFYSVYCCGLVFAGKKRLFVVEDTIHFKTAAIQD